MHFRRFFCLLLLSTIYLTIAQEFEAHPVEDCVTEKEGVRVAVIGAGIGGSTATFYVDQELNHHTGKRGSIDVYERMEYVGGRLHHIDAAGTHIEVGGAVYHIVNYLVRNFTFLHNLTEVTMSEDAKTFGLWNGKEFLFQHSPYKLVTIAKVLWRYGLSPKTAEKVVHEAVDKFLQLYPKLVDSKEAFSTVKALFDSVNLTPIIQQDLKTLLQSNGVGDAFIDEIATAITRINYGQDTKMHSLAGTVSLFAEGDNLVRIDGGNSELCRHILDSSGATLHLNTPVSKIQVVHKNGKPKYIVTATDFSTKETKEETYDIVVIATPLEIANIEIEGIEPLPEEAANRPYQITHVTIVAGKLSKKYFGKGEDEELPDTIGTTEGVQFSSISVKGVGKEYPVYKIFSRTEMSDDFLDNLFDKRIFTKKLHWHAYPVMIPTNKFPPIKLHDQLYYLNSVENALSCMEAEAISAKNIANLIAKSWKL